MARLTKAGLLLATNDVVLFQTSEVDAAGVEIGDTFVGTVTLEATIDGTTWFAATCLSPSLAAVTNTLTAPGRRVLLASGMSAVRARFTRTSGQVSVVFAGTEGALPPGNTAGVGGIQTPTNIQTFRTQITGAQTDFALVTVATGTRIALTRIFAKAGSVNTLAPTVLIGFGVATVPTGAGVVMADGSMAAGSGIGQGNGGGLIGAGADDEDLRITCGNPGGNIEVFGSYFTF